MIGLWMGREPYDSAAKAWLARSGHYLENPPPGCLFACAVREAAAGLFGEAVADGPRLGLCLVGRPVARKLPQDGTWAEVTRLVLVAGLPHGTASALLRAVIGIARARRRIRVLIAYHDRIRHTGCIYRKAGFRKDGVTSARVIGWGTRSRPKSGAYEAASKRRWRFDLAEAA